MSASSKWAVMHQQGPWAMPVRRSISMAHTFGVPQSGQRVGSTVGESGMARLSSALAVPTQRAAPLRRKVKCDAIGLDSGSTYTTPCRAPSIGLTCVS